MSRISAYTALTTAASNDVLPIVDVSDTSMAPTGTTKKIAVANLGIPLQASTGTAGYALVNGTGTIISWTAPADGALHRAALFGSLHCTVTATGGLINASWTGPDGTAATHTFYSAGQTAGSPIQPGGAYLITVQAGTTVSIAQGSALTGGAASLWAEIWGS